MIPESRDKDKFDEYSVEIGRRIFDLQILISRYTADLLKEFPDELASLESEISLQIDGVYQVKNIVCIFYDEDSDLIKINSEDGYESDFGDLDVCSQQILSDSLLMKLRSDKIFRNLSGNMEKH